MCECQLPQDLLRLSGLSLQTDSQHTFRAAPQTELVTSAYMLASEFLCLDALHAPFTYGLVNLALLVIIKPSSD